MIDSDKVPAASSSGSRARTSAVLIGVATVLAFALVVYLESKPINEPLGTPIDGLPGTIGAVRPAPEIMTLGLNGSPLRLSDYRGRVLILDFWASWCAPCRGEIPILEDLANQNRDRGLQVLGLTIENPTREGENVRRFVEEMKIHYPIGYATEELFAAYIGPGEHPIPQTLIFGRDGKLRRHLVGFAPQSDLKKLRETVSLLLKEKP